MKKQVNILLAVAVYAGFCAYVSQQMVLQAHQAYMQKRLSTATPITAPKSSCKAPASASCCAIRKPCCGTTPPKNVKRKKTKNKTVKTAPTAALQQDNAPKKAKKTGLRKKPQCMIRCTKCGRKRPLGK